MSHDRKTCEGILHADAGAREPGTLLKTFIDISPKKPVRANREDRIAEARVQDISPNLFN